MRTNRHRKATFLASAVFFGLSPPALASTHESPDHLRRFAKLARNITPKAEYDGDGALEVRDVHTLSKRGGYSGRATFFAPGLGACGLTSSASDYIVALNVAQYGDTSAVSSWCFKKITISYGGRSTTAEIVDACPGCPYGGLDMSPGLFQYFASENVGVFYMNWQLAGSSQPESETTSSTTYYTPSTTTQQWTSTSTSTWSPPSSTWVQTSTSTPWTPSSSSTSTSSLTPSSTSSSTTSSSSSKSTSSSTTTSASNSTVSSSSSSSTSTLSPLSVTPADERQGGNLDKFAQVVLGAAGLVGAAAAQG